MIDIKTYKRKTLLLITITLLSALFLIACNSTSKMIEDIDLDEDFEIKMSELISQYIEENVAHRVRGGKSFEAHELYGYKQKDNSIYAYLWTYFMEYYESVGKLEKGGGGSFPVVIVLEKSDEGKYIAINHYEPRSGSQYSKSIKELFPKEYHEKIFERPNNIDELSSIVVEKAENYYGKKINYPKTASLKHIYRKPVSIITIEDLSMEPLPIPIQITNQKDIYSIVEALNVDDWKEVSRWEYDYFPSIFMQLNDDMLICLFGSRDGYAKTEMYNIGKYYEIPPNIYDDVKKIIYEKYEINDFSINYQGNIVSLKKWDFEVKNDKIEKTKIKKEYVNS